MNNQRRNLNVWKEVIEKAIDIEGRTSLEPLFGTKKINFRCPKSYRSSVKKNKDKANQKHWDEDKDKAKPHNPSLTNRNQLQMQTSKKYYGSRQESHLVTEVNITEIVKNYKDKAKNLSHIECDTCKQKGYYTHKCPKKKKI